MTRSTWWLGGVLLGAAVFGAVPADAQVVREQGARSLAGVLTDAWDDYTFQSRGGEILFADVDSDVYQTAGRMEHDHEEDGDTGGEGCAEGGPGRLCLQVLDAAGALVCWAERPARPGWQRDPRLACPLPETGGAAASYTLRLAIAGEHEQGCGQADSYPTPADDQAIPYLINVTVRSVAPEGPLSRALGISTDAR